MIWNVLKAGGVTIYVLLLCSLLSLTVIVERVLYYRKRSRVRRADFMGQIRSEFAKHGADKAKAVCHLTQAPFASVVLAGLDAKGAPDKEISDCMERQMIIETAALERFTSITATIGSTAVYIGLFGTVLGIIRAFRDIAASSGSGINVVVNGISEALVCTAAGLAVAIPAVIAYNYFSRRIETFATDMELSASETLNLLTKK
ncbi:MAG: MotA/TolQ/ExbB proton channel family protein [Deltaproteobacteria bacterium]